MYIIIDLIFSKEFLNCGFSPNPNNHDIESISLIITDLKDQYEQHNYALTEIDKCRSYIESNIVISYCYNFEKEFLNKYKIFPKYYIDLNTVLGIGGLRKTCEYYKVIYNQEDICQTLYLLFKTVYAKIKILDSCKGYNLPKL